MLSMAKPSTRQPTLTEPGTCRIGERSSAAISISGHAVTASAKQFDPDFDHTTVETRPSKGGNYLGITITVTATSRPQLDELYRTLTAHPMVKIVL